MAQTWASLNYKRPEWRSRQSQWSQQQASNSSEWNFRWSKNDGVL